MFDFQQKRKLRTWAKSRLVWVVLGVVTMFVGASAFSRYQIAKDMEERRITVETEAALLEARRAELESEVQYLSNERGVEAEMRRQFDIAREGEQVVIILEDEQVVEASSTAAEETPKEPWYKFW